MHHGNSTRFLYHKADSPLAATLGWKPTYTSSDLAIDVVAACLADACSATCRQASTPLAGGSNCSHIYFSADLAHAALSRLAPHLLPAARLEAGFDAAAADPVPPLAVDDVTRLRQPAAAATAAAQPTRQFLWLGGAGAATPTHYDDAHNVYVQLYGVKRFYLFPPWRHKAMAVYPVAHPHDRQAQVPWTPTLDAAELAAARATWPAFWAAADDGTPASAYCVTLHPGDRLLLPAGWFHYVQALTPSASTNVWTRAASWALLHQLFANMLPFAEAAWPTDQRRLAVQRYVPLVVRAVLCAAEEEAADGGKLDAAESACHAHHVGEAKETERKKETDKKENHKANEENEEKEKADMTNSDSNCSALGSRWLYTILSTAYTPSVHASLKRSRAAAPPVCSQARGRGLDLLLAPYVSDVARTFAAMPPCARHVALGTWVQAALELVTDAAELPAFASACLQWAP